MPYVKSEHRTDETIFYPENPGELNYAITMLLIVYLENKGLAYTNIAETLAACTEAGAEFRRRVLVPYEEQKRAENGDVYPPTLTNGGVK